VRSRVALVLLVAAAAGVFLVTVPTFRHFFDLGVYRGAVRHWLLDGGDLYAYRYQGTGYGFTYPPFAALVLSPLALSSWPVAIAASLVVNAAAVTRLLRWSRPRAGWTEAALLFVAVIVFEPARDTFSFGQINLVLLVLVCADLAALTRGSRWAGVGIGIAAAVKLTPAVFVGYLLVTRRYLAAAVAAGTAVAATLLAVLLAPDASRTFWTSAVWDTSRVGRLAYVSNQSLRGVVARLDADVAWWLAAAALVLAVWWLRARRAAAAGDDPAGFALTGALACLLSPVTWVHHLVWLLPALFVLVDRRRWPVAATLWLVLSSSIVWLWWSGSSGWVAAAGSNTYVWITVGLLLLLPITRSRPGHLEVGWPPSALPNLSRHDRLHRAAPGRTEQRHRRRGPEGHAKSDRAMNAVPEWADPAVPDRQLDRQGLSRRGMLRRAGLFGAGFAAAAALGPAEAAAAAPAAGQASDPDLVYLVGDHHVHTVYSHDAKYTVAQTARRAAQYGLDWMVCTEHSNVGHDRFGAELEHTDILAARAENPRLLIFQGLEWYIPGAEHATVFTAPGPGEASLLRDFERAFDGKLLASADEALAVAALKWLASRPAETLVLANHPSRLGIDSPHELRAWRDAAPGIMIGMEGAPGAQGAAMPGLRGATSIRGEYENKPSAQSWPGYPPAAYVTYGGFDWMTATVGGLWDALLAEGRLFTVTSNSDSHRTVFDTLRNGDWAPGASFDTTGKVPDPVEAGAPQPGSDFWPGQFSRTHVGVTGYGYRQVMEGLRRGRVWVDHGQLVDGIEVRLSAPGGRAATLGGRLRVRRGERLTLTVTVTSATRPNLHGTVPRLAYLDVIRGAVRGPDRDRDAWRAPDTRVIDTADVSRRAGRYTLRFTLTARESSYLRIRGADGRRNGPGQLGRHIDPHGPLAHPPGDGDPWLDTWLYTNPIFVDVA